jgi:putative tryptophan/tyrosine transport system substrate-binding protein
MIDALMQRRDFITLLGGAAAAWPLGARAQQPSIPVIGQLTITSAAEWVTRGPWLRQGLSERGYVEGRNVAFDTRYGAGQLDRLPELAADIVRRRPAVIVSGGPPSVRALKEHTSTIPIVFIMGEDPVKEGLVASFNRPGGNITGISYFTNVLFAKRMQLLNEIVPRPAPVALLVNSNNPNAGPDSQDALTAASALGRELHVLSATSERGIEEAFVAAVQRKVGGLVVGVDSLFFDRRDYLFALMARHSIPAIYERREYTMAGGLMSYGAEDAYPYRQAGVYAGRILRGEKPADLPVLQPTKFDFVINLRIARFLGLTIPPGVLAIADEVIE